MKTIIEATRLNKIYRRGAEEIKAVNDIDLSISEGEFVSFVGPSGSGKTTLLHLLGCLDNPTSGTISIGGEKVFVDKNKISEKLLTQIRRQYFGYVFQRFYLIPTLSVKENIMLPFAFHKNQGHDDVLAIADKLGLAHRLSHLPKEISGGEMQRVAIARALVNSPRILLADEPTGNLDSKRCNEIAGILTTLNREEGITIVLVTHNRELAEKGTRIVELRDGMID